MPDTLRIAFAGTPDFAAESLKALLASRHDVVGVWTQPDRPAGRGRKLMPGPVKALALEHGLPVHQPLSLKQPEDRAALSELTPDVLVVVAYGLILPQAVLDLPRLGAINVHASLLPRWRGAAPIQRAIEAGDTHSGVTIMQMDAGLDTGAMLIKTTTAIDEHTTGGALHDRLAADGAAALLDTLEQLATGTAQPEAQPDEGVTYAHKLSKADAQLDFSQPAAHLARTINAFNPWPVAWATLGDDTLRLWQAHAEPQGADSPPGTLLESDRQGLRIACGEGTLVVTRAQLPGGKPLPVQDLLNSKGERFTPGTRLQGCTS